MTKYFLGGIKKIFLNRKLQKNKFEKMILGWHKEDSFKWKIVKKKLTKYFLDDIKNIF